MNAVEIVLFLSAIVASAALCIRRNFHPKRYAFLLILLPALWIVIPRSTQFLTVDEKSMISEPVSLSTSALKQWSNGAFRTTDIAIGPVMSLARSSIAMNEEQSARIAKALHWIVGFCTLVALIILIKPFWAGADEPFFPILILVSALLLPTSAIAFNMCNYDLFSMLLAALSLTLMAWGFSRRAPRTLLVAVAIAALAAQEKLIATPILWFALVAYIATRQLRLDVTSVLKNRCIVSLKATIEAFCVAATVIAASYAILIAVRSGGLPSGYYGTNPFKIILPLVSPLVILLRGMGGAGMLGAIEEAAKHTSPLLLWTMIIIGSVTAIIIAAMLVTLVTGFVRRPAWSLLVRYAGHIMPRVNYILLAATACAGICATFCISGYWAPMYPVAPGNYVPGAAFNGVILHFGAATWIGHHIRLLGWAYAVFYNAMPSALLLCMLVAGPWRWFTIRPLPLAVELLVSICLIAPALYAAGHIPLQNRYFNLFLLLLLIATALRFFPLARMVKPLNRYGIGLALVSLLAVELFPFRPAFGLFRPLWSDLGVRQNNLPVAGVINPVTLGGGEELMLAGEMLKRSGVHLRPEGIRLYHNHYGAWLGEKRGVTVLDMADHSTALSYTGRDYYIVDRLSVVQDWLTFPGAIEPDFTIAARGYIQAWVYRGNDLAKKGFTFRQ